MKEDLQSTSRAWGERLLGVLMLMTCAGCCIYDSSTHESMLREGVEVERDPATQIALGAEPRSHRSGNRRACLLLHGFASSPADFGDLPERLHAAGFDVEAPLLPGHGSHPQDLAEVSWTDWVDSARSAYDELAERHDEVSVVGFSLGGSLSVILGRDRAPHRVVLWSPYASVTYRWYHVLPAEWWNWMLSPFIRYVRKSDGLTNVNDKSQIGKFFYYRNISTAAVAQLFALGREARQAAPDVTCPILVFHAKDDSAASPAAALELFERFASDEKGIVWLEASDHIIGWDFDRDRVLRESVEFLAK